MAQLNQSAIKVSLDIKDSHTNAKTILRLQSNGTNGAIGLMNGTSFIPGITFTTAGGTCTVAQTANKLAKTLTINIGDQTLTTNGENVSKLDFTASKMGLATQSDLNKTNGEITNFKSDTSAKFKTVNENITSINNSIGTLNNNVSSHTSSITKLDSRITNIVDNKTLVSDRMGTKGYLIVTASAKKQRVWKFSIIDKKGKKDQLKCFHETKTHYEGGPGKDWITGTSICTATSDIRLKTNIKNSTTPGLELINQIQLREFDWIDSGVHQKIGFIADELELLDPLLTNGGGYEEDGSMNVKSVDPFYLQGYEIKAIKELSAENQMLKNKINELEKRLNKLEK